MPPRPSTAIAERANGLGPDLDLGCEAGQPRDGGRVRDDEGGRPRRLEDRGRPLAPGRHQNVTVRPPSTVSTWPVVYVLRSLASQATCSAISAGIA